MGGRAAMRQGRCGLVRRLVVAPASDVGREQREQAARRPVETGSGPRNAVPDGQAATDSAGHDALVLSSGELPREPRPIRCRRRDELGCTRGRLQGGQVSLHGNLGHAEVRLYGDRECERRRLARQGTLTGYAERRRVCCDSTWLAATQRPRVSFHRDVNPYSARPRLRKGEAPQGPAPVLSTCVPLRPCPAATADVAPARWILVNRTGEATS